jgi:hypothetical protein
MKKLKLWPAIITLLLSNSGCSKNNVAKYKGKLEIKGICMNYTIRLLEGNIDTAKITPNWTDVTTGNHYVNVFGLGSPCNFPAALKEGDEFYFSIDTKSVPGCVLCMAYYPTPPKKLSIKVIE